MTTAKAKRVAIGIALVAIGSGGVWAQQVQAVHGAYLVLSAPPLQGIVGDTLHVYRATEKGPLFVATVEIDELRADQAICKILWEAPGYKVQLSDWAAARDGRPPRSVGGVGGTEGGVVVAVRGGLALIDSLTDSMEPGCVMVVERSGSAGGHPIGTVRLFSAQKGHGLASIVQEDSTTGIAPGDRARVQAVLEATQGAKSVPRVAKVTEGFLFVEGLPEEWPCPAHVRVLRLSPCGGQEVATARLVVRKGDRGIATVVRGKQRVNVRPGDVLALPERVPVGCEEDLDTYFFGPYRPRQ